MIVARCSWEWSYILEERAPERTQVTILYSWGVGLGLLGLGTVKAQASNEAAETIRALTALEKGFKASKAANGAKA